MAKDKKSTPNTIKPAKVKKPKADKANKTAKLDEQAVEDLKTDEVVEQVKEVADVEPEVKTKGKAKGKAVKVKAAEEEKPKATGRTLNALTKVIASALTQNAMNSVRIGQALDEAKMRFDKTKDLIAWAEGEFNFKRSTVYNYLNIFNVFGSDDMQAMFKDVSYRVLTQLSSNPEMLDSAVKAIDEGIEITAEWLNDWKEERNPTPAKEKSKKGEDGEGGGNREDEYIDGLIESNEALKARVQELESGSSAGGNSTDLVGSTLEAHFKGVAERLSSLDPLNALNLSAGAVKRDINAAKRDLIKLYHPDIYGDVTACVGVVIESQAAKALAALK